MDKEKEENKKPELQEDPTKKKLDVIEDDSDSSSDHSVNEPDNQTAENDDAETADTQDIDKIEKEENTDENSQDNLDDTTDSVEQLDKNKTLAEAMDEADNEPSRGSNDIDKAVDDIVRTESDEVIAEADAKIEALQHKKEKKSLKDKIKAGIVTWWDNKPARYGTFAGLFILFIAITLLPVTRYSVLNLFGVRVNSSMSIIDAQTRLPLKNISVNLQDKSATTNTDGYVEFSDLKLGSSELRITKRGYADNISTIVLGWGSNPIGEQEIVATGEQFTFVLSDWQSDKPIVNAEATAGENSARADDEGKIILTVGEENISNVEVVIDAENYRQETISSENLTNKVINLKLVPSRKHVFVSNRSGEYDIYKIDLDKQNEEILLGSTGNEREVPVVLPHPTRNLVALVSSRDGEENRDGFILDGLFIIDVDSGETKRIARSEQLQLLGWTGDNLVFWQIVEGTSKANPERSKIISYNERTAERTDIAAANYFNDIELVDSTIYYAVSSFAVPQSQAKLYSLDIDSDESTEVLLDQQVWSIYRTGYEQLILNAENQKWYELLGNDPVKETTQQPAPQQIDYVNSLDNSKTAWVEVRDGKGVLLTSNTDDFEEQVALTLPGLNEVLYWANESSVVFRVITGVETADYILDFTNNEPLKISDVTATQNRFF